MKSYLLYSCQQLPMTEYLKKEIPGYDDTFVAKTDKCKKIVNWMHPYLLGAKNMKSVQLYELCNSTILPLLINAPFKIPIKNFNERFQL